MVNGFVFPIKREKAFPKHKCKRQTAIFLQSAFYILMDGKKENVTRERRDAVPHGNGVTVVTYTFPEVRLPNAT